jgi:hypothetical protein
LYQLGTLEVIDYDKSVQLFERMTKLRRRLPGTRQHPRLTSEEFSSLKELGNRPIHRTIPDEHRDRLIEAGFIREVVRHSGNVSALALTGRGLRRLDLGK